MDSTADRIAASREKIARLEARLTGASAASESATPGGLTGYDPAVLSGIRRKANHKADARRFAAYDREAAAWRELDTERLRLKALERGAARAAQDAADRALVTPDAIKAAAFVRDSFGWHRVVRVSAKSVTVKTAYSWDERIAVAKILETRPAGGNA